MKIQVQKNKQFYNIRISLFLTLFGVLFFCTQAKAVEQIITNPVQSAKDKRLDYSLLLLEEAMKRTEKSYGPFEIKRFGEVSNRKRALRELIAGEISVFYAATNLEWEAETIPIRIPLIKGLLGYRLLLINKEDQEIFSSIKDEHSLKVFRYGGGDQWSVTLALKKLGFQNYGGIDYEQLFSMLNAKRFDYFPRGITEIFTEFSLRSEQFPHMAIEKDIALYLPLPSYFFVSPKKPALAERLETGLISMINDGTFDKMFYEYHSDAIQRADIKNRRIITLKNLNLSPETPFDRKEFWYQPN